LFVPLRLFRGSVIEIYEIYEIFNPKDINEWVHEQKIEWNERVNMEDNRLKIARDDSSIGRRSRSRSRKRCDDQNRKSSEKGTSLLLFLLTVPFYPVRLQFSYDVDVQLSHRFGGCPGDPEIFDFPSFAIFVSQLSSIPFTCLPVLSPEQAMAY